MAKRPAVTVLGSLNMDISVTVPRLPAPGVTVLGSAARFTPGGKGANQAVAAARLGADVRMAGCVGGDDFGRQLVASLRAEGIETSAVRTVAAQPTGVALITVDETGENIITVAPGANQQAGPPEVAAATAVPCDVLVLSAEIPLATITQALAAATQAGARTLLNLAPAAAAARKLLEATGLDWLVVNESEAAALLGQAVTGLPDAERAARDLQTLGPRNAVVTAGAAGAAWAGPESHATIPGFRVEATDTVGAGDTFVGALAVALAANVPAADAIRAAAAAAATSVTTSGAQAAMPRPAEIQTATGLNWPVVHPEHTER
jgi:ribokinase